MVLNKFKSESNVLGETKLMISKSITDSYFSKLKIKNYQNGQRRTSHKNIWAFLEEHSAQNSEKADGTNFKRLMASAKLSPRRLILLKMAK